MTNKLIGEKLSKLRKAKGWSQEETADYLNITRSVYQRIETGSGCSWATYLNRICEVFEIQPEELVKNENLVLNNGQSGGTSHNALVINQLSEKLIEQYEERILQYKVEVKELKETISQLKK